MKRLGFTLVELVVVVLILGILSAVAAPKVISSITASRDVCAQTNLQVVRDAVELFTIDNGRLPGADGNESTFKDDLSLPSCPSEAVS